MKVPRYELKADKSLMFFEFVSEGPKGRILKLVEYDETNLKGFYNLAFGDLDEKTGRINDLSISNNGDSEKVLATVVSTLYAFTDKYKNSLIYAKGSTEARTRMYRMGITKYLDEIIEDFQILGFRDNEWQVFEKGHGVRSVFSPEKKNLTSQYGFKRIK